MKARKGRLGLVLAAVVTMMIASHGVSAQSNVVTVTLVKFGVGNTYRPGDITAIRLQLTSELDSGKKCQIQLETKNADGDVVAYFRNVVVNPGAGTPPVWLYIPVSPHDRVTKVSSVRVFDFEDDRLGAELGGARISPASIASKLVSDRKAMICVVGRARMGLDDYDDPGRPDRPYGAHEGLHLETGLAIDDLPDRWYGLSSYEAVVWSDSTTAGLTEVQASALTEYVQRGGHFIVVLPASGSPWGFGNPAQARLSELLISQSPRRDEPVMLSEIAPLLHKHRTVTRDFETSIRVFADIDRNFNVIDNHFEPLIALPDKRVVVIQRTYGYGRVTLIGINVASNRLAATRTGLPQADVFWNRILGRRSDTPSQAELRAMDTAEVLLKNQSTPVVIGDGKLVQDLLAKSGGAAGAGIFAALVLFAIYWFVAGPGGFLILKQRKMTRHSWLAFVLTAAVCTGVAWAGVRVLRQNNVEINHLTVLDFLARTPDDPRIDEPLYWRASSWFSLYVPGYGGAEVVIDSANGQHDVLFTYIPPERRPQPFPNVDRYTVDCANGFNFHLIPTRATATEMQAQWVGPLNPDWGGTIRPDPADPIRVEIDPVTGRPRLRGKLTHDLPGELTNGIVIWVGPDRLPDRLYLRNGDVEYDWVPPLRAGQLLNNGEMFALAGPYSRWVPGVVMPLADLGRATGQTKLDTNIYKRNMQPYESTGAMGMSRVPESLEPLDRRRFLELLSFYQGLRPPRYYKQQRGDQSGVSFARQLGRGLDLSAWLNRPCLIIIGYLENSRSPIPLMVKGEEPPNNTGLTMVRWIYPLPLDESEVVADARKGDAATDDGN